VQQNTRIRRPEVGGGKPLKAIGYNKQPKEGGYVFKGDKGHLRPSFAAEENTF
jgi:hypothetical protein